MIFSTSCLKMMFPVCLFLFLYMIVYAFHARVIPQLIESRVCLKRYNQTICDNLKDGTMNRSSTLFYSIQNEVISWDWKMQLTSAVPSMITVFFFGIVVGLTKNIKRIMLLCTVLFGLQSLIYFSVGWFTAAPVFCLLIGNILTTLYGGFQGALLLAYVYIVRITKPDEYRTIKFAILEGTSYCAFALGRFAADYIVYELQYKGAFGITLAVCVVNFVFVLSMFPSTTVGDDIGIYVRLGIDVIDDGNHNNAIDDGNHIDDAKHTDDADHSNTDSGSKMRFWHKIISILSSECNQGSMEYLAVIILSSFLFSMGQRGRHELMPNVVNWQNVGLSQSGTERYIFLLRLAQGLASAPLVILLTKACCMATDVIVLFTALSSYSLSLVLIGFSRTTATLFTVSIFALFEPLALATFVSVATKEIHARAQGAVIGLLGSLDLVAMILLKFVGYTYTENVHHARRYQYVAFLVLSIIVLMAFIIVGIASRHYQKPLIEFHDNDKPKEELKPLLDTS